MREKQSILQKISEYEHYMVATRRYLHENPEVSGKEYDTSAFLKQEVSRFGLPITEVQGTGFYAVLDTGKVGKTIGVRTDIDALPMVEKDVNLKGKRVCCSKRPGAMHACGHDGHMATVLASIQLLLDIKEELQGKIVFIFEEGEEIGSGISHMIEALRPLGLDAVYGVHLTAFMQTGEICIDSGARMAGAALIEFDIIGRGGHGSRPDLSINPVFAMANVLTGIASAWANQIDVSKTVTLGLSQCHAGTANNVFPDSAFVGGTLRYFDINEGKKALDIFKHVASKTAQAHLCQAVFRESMGVLTAPVINDDTLSKIARQGARELYGDKVIEHVPWYASETFADYAKLAPIVFAFVGIANSEIGSGAEHHNVYFDLDEKALTYSLGTMVKFVIDYLTN
ncbi:MULTISPECIES: amidohydrolase [unclassified Granulicatella]|uniref:amidohydrolase n=1 Tax=unclassified Granulicatella TaxID=2630493 RepID=UPI00107483A0|nr:MULTISPECIES: amidohydrolase [unclassified Granulicatella]MBF0780531.1 amidohydrolase [Granulicatella sp. 19428wC4_WM01]TFU94936.1 amidohydrolase [Granulicatella sp. WM01]